MTAILSLTTSKEQNPDNTMTRNLNAPNDALLWFALTRRVAAVPKWWCTHHIEAIGGKVVDDPQKAIHGVGRQVLVARHPRICWGWVAWEDCIADWYCSQLVRVRQNTGGRQYEV